MCQNRNLVVNTYRYPVDVDLRLANQDNAGTLGEFASSDYRFTIGFYFGASTTLVLQ